MKTWLLPSSLLLVLIPANSCTISKKTKLEKLMQEQEAAEQERLDEAAEEKQRATGQNGSILPVVLLYNLQDGFCMAPSPPSVNCSSFDPDSFQRQPSYFTLDANGRLGNQMSALATAYAIAKDSPGGWKQVLLKPYKESLSEYFPAVEKSFEAIEDLYCNPCELPTSYMSPAEIEAALHNSSYDSGHYIVHRGYFFSLKHYKKYLMELSEIFAFKPEVQEKVKTIITAAKMKHASENDIAESDIVTVGVHVRRTDMLKELGRGHDAASTVAYFDKARRYFVRKHAQKHVLFLAVSDDPEWCHRNLVRHDTVFAGALESKEQAFVATSVEMAPHTADDMALLAASEGGVIVSHGTYGQWGALLAAANAERSGRGPIETVAPTSDKGLVLDVGRAEMEGWKFQAMDE